MQSLKVVARLFPLVVSGEKTSTIRFRETRIVPGDMTYVCDDDPAQTVVVHVTRCTEMKLSQVAAFLGKRAEWPRKIMLEGMKKHYPSIAWDDPVQVVEHLTPAQSRER